MELQFGQIYYVIFYVKCNVFIKFVGETKNINLYETNFTIILFSYPACRCE